MFGIEYIAAFIKIFWQIGFAIVSAIPFRLAWNAVASNLLSEYIPQCFIGIGFWHFVAIILTLDFLGESISKITPRIVSFSSSKKVGK
jgi:hypothetical protein